MEKLLFKFYLLAKNNTQAILKETNSIKVSSLNSTSNKTVNYIISINNQNKISLSEASLNELAVAAADASDLDNTNASLALHIIIVMLYSILILISLTSNPLLIYVLLIKRKTQLKLIDVFVINLSISDFFLTIFNIPLCLTIFFSGKWLFGTLICKLGTYSTSSAIYINILTMAYISVDRYFAVTRPLISNRCTNLRINTYNFDYATKRKMYIALAVIWFFAFTVSIPQFIFTKIAKIDGNIANDEEFLAAAQAVSDELSLLDNLGTSSSESSTGKYNADTFNVDYFITPSINVELRKNNEVHFSKFGEGLMNRCTMEYPLKNMKFYMVILNFSLQYLLPSLVILFFYGKIIYHLYLNLNIDILFPTSSSEYQSTYNLSHSHHQHHQNGHSIVERKMSNDSEDSGQHKMSITKTDLLSRLFRRGTTHHIASEHGSTVTGISVAAPHPDEIRARLRSKGSLMRVDGINRANNLKKSIKIMIIIIVSFLISWLPIHLYRLVTTFHPFLTNKPTESKNTLNLFNLEAQNNFKNCTIDNFIQCLDLNEGLGAGGASSRRGNKYTTIHNRYLFFFFHFLSMSSVCYNPIVYFWLHKKFRKEVKSMLSKILLITAFIRNNTINRLRNRRAMSTLNGTIKTTTTFASTRTNNNNNNNRGSTITVNGATFAGVGTTATPKGVNTGSKRSEKNYRTSNGATNNNKKKYKKKDYCKIA